MAVYYYKGEKPKIHILGHSWKPYIGRKLEGLNRAEIKALKMADVVEGTPPEIQKTLTPAEIAELQAYVAELRKEKEAMREEIESMGEENKALRSEIEEWDLDAGSGSKS